VSKGNPKGERRGGDESFGERGTSQMGVKETSGNTKGERNKQEEKKCKVGVLKEQPVKARGEESTSYKQNGGLEDKEVK